MNKFLIGSPTSLHWNLPIIKSVLPGPLNKAHKYRTTNIQSHYSPVTRPFHLWIFPENRPQMSFANLNWNYIDSSLCENREITINYINLKTMTWTYDCIQGWVIQGLWRRPRRGESSKGDDDEDRDWTRRKSMGGDRFTGQKKSSKEDAVAGKEQCTAM